MVSTTCAQIVNGTGDQSLPCSAFSQKAALWNQLELRAAPPRELIQRWAVADNMIKLSIFAVLFAGLWSLRRGTRNYSCQTSAST